MRPWPTWRGWWSLSPRTMSPSVAPASPPPLVSFAPSWCAFSFVHPIAVPAVPKQLDSRSTTRVPSPDRDFHPPRRGSIFGGVHTMDRLALRLGTALAGALALAPLRALAQQQPPQPATV